MFTLRYNLTLAMLMFDMHGLTTAGHQNYLMKAKTEEILLIFLIHQTRNLIKLYFDFSALSLFTMVVH